MWDEVELAVIRARVELGRVPVAEFQAIEAALSGKPVDLEWWERREAETGHDYDAYCDERKRHLPPDLQHRWHEDLTTYDGQDPAFMMILNECVGVAKKGADKLCGVLFGMARRYRYCISAGKTHRQFAELQSFGKRCINWLVEFRTSYQELVKAECNLRFGKLAGPVGNYGLLDPELERKTCSILGLEVFYGVTQIIPRELLVPVANALSQMVQTMYKIANDICESTTGAHPICHVPFPKKGKGSSAMAWKRNPWRLEGIKGMADMAIARRDSIAHTIQTAFERDMGQSCVERNEWPDLFHIVIYSMKTMVGVLEKLEVYPDNMMLEIIEMHGVYAGLAVRDFLIKMGFGDQDAYRIVQTAAWMTLRPTPVGAKMREGIQSAEEARRYFDALRSRSDVPVPSIEEIISAGQLEHIPTLEPTPEQIAGWNQTLRSLFANQDNSTRWTEIFTSAFERTFKNEDTLFKEVLGE
jgi:adenylosuccinate lyase